MSMSYTPFQSYRSIKISSLRDEQSKELTFQEWFKEESLALDRFWLRQKSLQIFQSSWEIIKRK